MICDYRVGGTVAAAKFCPSIGIADGRAFEKPLPWDKCKIEKQKYK